MSFVYMDEFTNSFNKYVGGTCHVPGSLLGSKEAAFDKVKSQVS